MPQPSKAFRRDVALGVLLPLVVASIIGGFAWYETQNTVRAEYGVRIAHVEAAQSEQRADLAAIREDLAKVREDTAFLRGRAEGR